MPTEFQVATAFPPALSEGDKVRAIMSKYRTPIGMDFVDWMVMIGKGYMIQVGTEDAPTDTTPVDDTTAHMIIDVPGGKTAMLAEVGTNIATLEAGTLAHTLVAADRGAVRYSSGGTAMTPRNLNCAYSDSSGLLGYVGPDITAAAKSAAADTYELEVARWTVTNDAKATETGDEIRNFLWSAKTNIWVILEGPASFVVYFGSATADVKGYAQMKVIDLT